MVECEALSRCLFLILRLDVSTLVFSLVECLDLHTADKCMENAAESLVR